MDQIKEYMKEKFKEFGGWLKFFYFLCLLNMVTSITMIFILGGEIFQPEGRPFIEILLEGAQIGIILYILYLIINVIQKRNSAVPEYIEDKLYIMFIVAFLYFIIHAIFTLPGAGWQLKNTVALTGSIQSMLWAAIWRTYFEKSERVRIYYRLNNQEKENNAPEEETDMV